MKLIVGLGNPGIEYQYTPHNMGFLAIDRLANIHGAVVSNRRCRAATGRISLCNQEVLLAKPETFMNLSGLSVRQLVQEFKADPAQDLIVVYDELDLPLGRLQIRQRGGTAGHNGVESIMGALGTDEFTRVRLGINPGHKVADGAKFVLGQFKKPQYPVIDEVLETAAEAVKAILCDGVAAAMNRFNRKPEPPERATTGGAEGA